MEDDLETQKPMGFDDDTFLPPKPVGPKEREKEKEKEKEREKECVLRGETHTHFSKPDIIQVREYCDEEGFTLVDPVKFVSYYDAVGWVCGGKPMKDWKATVRLWNCTERAKAGEGSGLEDTWNPGGIGTVV